MSYAPAEVGSVVKVVPHGLHQKTAFLLSIGSSISHRFVMIQARLVLLLVICAAVMVTAMLTWKFSLNATERSNNHISIQLRQDVTQGATEELKAFLERASTASYSLYRSLSGLDTNFSSEQFPTTILPLLWGAFSTNPEFGTVHVATWQDVQGGYRRDGPEAPLLGSREAVGVPSQPNDTLGLTYGFIPDPETGRPVTNGSMLILCVMGLSCPTVSDPAVYIPATVRPTKGLGWLNGRNLAKGGIKIIMSIPSNREPSLQVISSFKDDQGKQVAILSITSTSTRLREFLQNTSLVRVYHGRAFIVEGSGMHTLSATHGPMYTPPATPGARPTFLSAVNSTDEIIRDTASFVNATFGARLFSEPIQAHARLSDGAVHYISAMPLYFEGMQLVVILEVPREEFHGDIENYRREGLIFTMVIVVVMFVVGGLAMCVSTTGISRKLQTQEKDLNEASAANKALREQLLVMTQVYSDDWPQVDMGTPLEKLTAIIKRLRSGRFLSQSQVQQMQTLITADDLHKPQFLAEIKSVEAEPGKVVGGRGRPQVDSETGTWIELLTMGRRSDARHDDRVRVRPSRKSLSENLRSMFQRLRARPTLTLDIGGDDSPGGSSHLSPVGALPSRHLDSDLAIAQFEKGTDGGLDDDGKPCSGGGGSYRGDGSSYRGQSLSAGGLHGESMGRHYGEFPGRPSHTRFLHLFYHVMGPMEPLALQMLRHVTSLALGDAFAGAGAAVSVAGSHHYGSGLSSASEGSCEGGRQTGVRRLLLASISISGGDGPGGGRASLASPLEKNTKEEESDDRKAGGEENERGKKEEGKLRTSVAESNLLVPLSKDQERQVALLRALGEWEFDTLALADATGEGQGILPLVGYSLFLREGLIVEFGIKEHKLANFLLQISRGMGRNPYHNAAHVADVSASLFHLLTRSGVGDHLRSIDKLAALVAALIHDYKHPGVNNDFLSRTREELATVYNDRSPLENFHLAEAFQLLYSNNHCNFLDVLSEEDFMELRRVVIEMVLATDLKRHFGVLDAFKARVSQEHPWDAERDSDRILLLQMALKVSDIGHTAKSLPMHVAWTQRVCEEFYRQGDAERALNLDISPFMDRKNINLPRTQLGFFQFLAMPLMDAWVKSFPRSTHLLSNMSANIEHWRREMQGSTV